MEIKNKKYILRRELLNLDTDALISYVCNESVSGGATIDLVIDDVIGSVIYRRHVETLPSPGKWD